MVALQPPQFKSENDKLLLISALLIFIWCYYLTTVLFWKMLTWFDIDVAKPREVLILGKMKALKYGKMNLKYACTCHFKVL